MIRKNEFTTMSETSDDLSALAWVYEEVRRSLDNAHKALRRFVKERDAAASSDVGEVDPSVLRGARVQVHQCAGALELVGLTPLAAVLRASEAAVIRFIAKPHKLNIKAVEDIEPRVGGGVRQPGQREQQEEKKVVPGVKIRK